MNWSRLPTDYTDAVWDGKKKYNLIQNDDGTISLEDVTNYTNLEKSFFGAKDANQMNEGINAIMTMGVDQVSKIDQTDTLYLSDGNELRKIPFSVLLSALSNGVDDLSALKASLNLLNGKLTELASTDYLTVCLSENFKLSKGTYEDPLYLPMSSVARSDGQMLLPVSNGVQVGANVLKVCISAQAYFYEASASQCEIDIYIISKDGSAKRVDRCVRTRSGRYETFATTPFVTSVSDGDIIKLAYIGNADASVRNYRDATFLNVEVVEKNLDSSNPSIISNQDLLLNKWVVSEKITGESGTENIYPDSDVVSSIVGDLCLNPAKGAVYQCTVAGTPMIAKWKYICAIGAGSSGDIPDQSVTEAKLADGSVTTGKLADGAVTGDKVSSLTIEGKHIKSRTITGARLALKTITENLLSDDLQAKLTSYVGTLAQAANDEVTLHEWWNTSDFCPYVLNVDYDAQGTITLHADDAKSGDHALVLRSGALVSFFEENGTECAVITQSDFGVAVVRRAADGSGTVTLLTAGNTGSVETWEPVFAKTFDADTTANQQWNLTKPCRKIRLRMAVAGSVANSAAGDNTVYINSYTSKCFLPNAFRFETATTKGSFAVAEVDITDDMVRVQANKSNIASNFNAANLMVGGTIWAASGITFNIFKDTEGHGAIKALSFPTNGKTIGAGTQIEILGVAK
jgi:hypothetical protein